MRTGIAIAVCTLACVCAVLGGDWDVHKVNSRDYVTLQNVADFYGFGARTVSGRRFVLQSGKRRLAGEIGSSDLDINGIKFILSYPVESSGGELLISRMDLSKLIEPVLRPSKIKGAENVRTIILDAGHGGHDRGARGLWGYEADFNLDVARRARDLLTRTGYDVKMTRSTDVFIPLHERASFANKYDGQDALFISIHFNSSPNGAATGIETFTLAPRGVPSFAQDGPHVSDFRLCTGNARDPENIALATAMHSSMLRRLQIPDRGIKRARFVVIREIGIPGVLLEGGFLSNQVDCRRVASSDYRQQLAYAITDAVRNYRTAVTGGLPPETERMARTAQNQPQLKSPDAAPRVIVK